MPDALVPDAWVTVTVRTDAPGRSDRIAALRRALGVALARLSGNPALDGDPRLEREDVAPLVLDLSYEDVMIDKPLNDEQGTRDRPFLLTVRFEAGALIRLLNSLGEKPWLGPRPRVAPMLTLRFRDGAERPLTADDPLLDRPRAALTAAATRYAVPVALPGAGAGAGTGVGAGVGAGEVPRRAIRLDARLEWVDAEFGWRGSFALRGDVWGVSGVSLDEAFRVLVGGAALRLRQ
ncbi:DUF2066 domain-containing protein [Roseomonas sp. CCTCC AB2023176]|uniref:DUF2066 domain-containing protein n=1 Tax=Roseomonas sp. CCTCC AB2023176 TaxID=3342640 RepID=UPI0035D609C4